LLVQTAYLLWKGVIFVKRVAYLAGAALVALIVLAPSALAQDAFPGDDDPYLPEQNAVVVEHDELERIAGKALPKTGGPSVSVILPAAALLSVGSGVLAYAVLRRGLEGGSAR
jgi:hypothetical protein